MLPKEIVEDDLAIQRLRDAVEADFIRALHRRIEADFLGIPEQPEPDLIVEQRP